MDLLLVETLNGGDLVKTPKDVSVIFGFQNVPYLAMFGGNIEESTPTERKTTQQYFDYWGNNLLMPNDEKIQFNSETERTLNNTVLNSGGRIVIENAVKKDLETMEAFAQVDVDVSILSDDRVKIQVTLKKPDNLKTVDFIYVWDATMQELSILVGSAGNAIPYSAGLFERPFFEDFFE